MKIFFAALRIEYIISFFVINIFVSCSPTKNAVYFETIQKDAELHNIVNNEFELKIRKNDLLSITIISPDPATTPLFNGSQGVSASPGGSGGGTGSATGGYLVDNIGNITLYKLGTIHVEGLTRNELKARLLKDLAPYLKDAVVTVRFLNKHVVMLGEVTKPQVLDIHNEQLSLLEAIAQSGDITNTGRKDDILIIRDTPDGKLFKKINLSNNSIFSSPFYYLRPNDVVVVQPTKYKIKNAAETQQIMSYILSGVSILVTIITLLGR